jgi:hypothetical protein
VSYTSALAAKGAEHIDERGRVVAGVVEQKVRVKLVEGLDL